MAGLGRSSYRLVSYQTTTVFKAWTNVDLMKVWFAKPKSGKLWLAVNPKLGFEALRSFGFQ